MEPKTTNVIAVAAGGNQSFALFEDGTVTRWGDHPGSGMAAISNVTAIAAGLNFFLALRNDGTIAALGDTGSPTNVPGAATNVVAIAAGNSHALALKENGTVVAWGLNTSGQCDVPTGLSNVMAVAAGRAHSAALKNDGTVICWGDNSAGQTNVGSGLSGIKLLTAGGDHTLASAFDKYTQYQVDVSKDLLLIYNSNSTDSSNVWHYYMQHRPRVNGANALGIDSIINETYLPEQFTNQLAEPTRAWLAANPTKRPQYVVLFPDIPSRVNLTNQPAGHYWVAGTRESASTQLHSYVQNWRPFITYINMGDTNACKAYIDKLAAFGTNGQIIISASAGGYGNINYVLDNVAHGSPGAAVWSATNGLLAAGVSSASIFYLEGGEPCIATETVTNPITGVVITNCIAYQPLPHLTNVVNVAGYISWGFHSSLDIRYAQSGYPQSVRWSGDSSWWIIETLESPNGQRLIYGEPGLFLKWFASSAFGGTNYSNTPVGGVTHTDEPTLSGVNDSAKYFGFWAGGKNFAMCAWNSNRTPHFQAVGDPLVRR